MNKLRKIEKATVIKNGNVNLEQIISGTPDKINKGKYLIDLAERQRKHLENIQSIKDADWTPCMHESCTSCQGIGIKADGTPCVHFISCPCYKCNPYFM